jgi:WD40-like Beta Propeller Repeat
MFGACIRSGAFPCAADVECGPGGVCESVGFCSFADPACGRRFGEAAGPFSNECVARDAGTDDGASDGALANEFPTPSIVPELSGKDYEDPTCTADELYMVLMHDLGGNQFDLFETSRSTKDLPWPTPTPINELNTGSQESSPELSSDGLIMFFTSNRSGGTRNVWTSTRTSRTDVWGTPIEVMELSSSSDEPNLAISSDGKEAIIDSGRDGERDLYRAIDSNGWSVPTAIQGLASNSLVEASPTLAADGTIYFHVQSNGFDIWRATPNATGGYDVAPVPALAGFGDPFVTPDRRRMFAIRNGDVYTAAR